MNFKELIVPYINKEDIKKEADIFRENYWTDIIPIDIEKIIDIKLWIDIIPTPNLERLCNADALISSDWQSIFIDEEKFNDEKYQNRLRFSLAHEVGHYVLHKDIYNSFDISSFDDFYRFIDDIPGDQYSYLETQANKFASHLLVPREKLPEIRSSILEEFKKSNKIDFNKIDTSLLNSYLARPIGKIFGVSAEAMEIILNEF